MSRYLEIIFSHWARFVLLLLVLPGALSVASIFVSRTWDASAAVWVEEPSYLGSSVTPNGWNQYLTPAQNQTDTLVQMLQTRSFADSLGASLQQSGAVTDTAERGAVLAGLAKGLKVTASGSHLVTMSYTCSRPVVCRDVMSGVLSIYHDRLASTEKQQADLAASVLTNQLQDAQATLNLSQTALERYLAEHPAYTLLDKAAVPALDALATKETVDSDQVQAIQQRLATARGTSGAVQRVVDTMSNVVDAPQVANRGVIGGRSAVTRFGMIVAACWVFAVGYLILLARLDRTARDPRELENRLHVPVIAIVPMFGEMKAS